MATLRLTAEQYERLRGHLRGDVEQAAFLLAEIADARTLDARQLRLMSPGDFAIQTGFHTSLSDNARGELIRWAWSNNCSIVELHSHGDDGTARFSPSDLLGFEEWVPHLWWRLCGRPYAAVVTAGDSFDGFLWHDSPSAPRQLERMVLDDGRVIEATALTLSGVREGVQP